MPIDRQLATNLTATIKEVMFSVSPDPSKKIASKLFLSKSMDRETVKEKIELPIYQLRNDTGGISGGNVSSRSPIFADITYTAIPHKDGLILEERDFLNYDFLDKGRQFARSASYLPVEKDEEMLARLLVRGHATKSAYSQGQLYFFDASNVSLPGAPVPCNFSNNINVGLTGSTPYTLTAKAVGDAISQGISAMRRIPIGQGKVLDSFKPRAVVCGVDMLNVVSTALNAGYYSTGTGGPSENVFFKTIYKDLEILSSPHIDAALVDAAADGVGSLGTNPTSTIWLIGDYMGETGAFVTGTFDPYKLDIPTNTQIQAGQYLTSYFASLGGRIAHAYGLPHYAVRLY